MNRLIALLSALVVVVMFCADGPSASAKSIAVTRAEAIKVTDAWIQATPPGAPVAAGYMHIANTSPAADRLLSLSSPRAARVDMHQMSMDGAMMTMRPILYGVVVPAGGAFGFTSDGAHIMFTNLTAPLLVGEQIPVRLLFERAGAVDISMSVRGGPGAAR